MHHWARGRAGGNRGWPGYHHHRGAGDHNGGGFGARAVHQQASGHRQQQASTSGQPPRAGTGGPWLSRRLRTSNRPPRGHRRLHEHAMPRTLRPDHRPQRGGPRHVGQEQVAGNTIASGAGRRRLQKRGGRVWVVRHQKLQKKRPGRPCGAPTGQGLRLQADGGTRHHARGHRCRGGPPAVPGGPAGLRGRTRPGWRGPRFRGPASPQASLDTTNTPPPRSAAPRCCSPVVPGVRSRGRRGWGWCVWSCCENFSGWHQGSGTARPAASGSRDCPCERQGRAPWSWEHPSRRPGRGPSWQPAKLAHRRPRSPRPRPG